MKPTEKPRAAVTSISTKERETLTSSPSHQDEAHRRGAFAYLDSIDMCTRYGCIAAYVRALRRTSVLDIGCGNGSLRSYLDEALQYHGIDVSPSAVSRARTQYLAVPRTTFECVDIRNMATPAFAYDCVVWAGVGHAYANSLEALAPGWQEILDIANDVLAPAGLLIVETIVSYEEIMASLISRYTVVSSWQVSCLSSSVHPRRIGWVLESIRKAAKAP